MRSSGHLRVDRGTANVVDALPEAAIALKLNSVVFVYPEGRIGRDPWLWPERGKTGMARLAATTDRGEIENEFRAPIAVTGAL